MRYDALIVGGGPAGSTCARFLVRAGLRVAVLDRAAFPRVKLCAGWLSAGIWDALALAPSAYPGALWRWDRCHVHYRGVQRTVTSAGYFIRRYELDDHLLAISGAERIHHAVDVIARDGADWVVDGRFQAPLLIGAGGTHCPVGRALFTERRGPPVAALEHEFCADPRTISSTRIGRDGEPELFLHDDLGGYAWNVPKSDWLNVGCGTSDPRAAKRAWKAARAHFEHAGHLAPDHAPELDRMKGHSYHCFSEEHLARAARPDGAFLLGDALGLAHPLTAEGILPAVRSGRHLAEAIASGRASTYPATLAADPLIGDYRALRHLARAQGRVASRARSSWPRPSLPPVLASIAAGAVAVGFARLFSGAPLPGGTWLHRFAAAIDRS